MTDNILLKKPSIEDVRKSLHGDIEKPHTMIELTWECGAHRARFELLDDQMIEINTKFDDIKKDFNKEITSRKENEQSLKHRIYSLECQINKHCEKINRLESTNAAYSTAIQRDMQKINIIEKKIDDLQKKLNDNQILIYKNGELKKIEPTSDELDRLFEDTL